MNAKEINNVFTDPDFVVKLLSVFNEYGIVSDVDLRNALIRKEHCEAKEKGENNSHFMDRMGEKYFCSPKTIDAILYGSGNKKKCVIPKEDKNEQ